MAKPGRVQTALEYGATRSLIAILGLLPPSVAMALGQQIGNLAFVLAGNLRKTGQRNLELAFPEKDEKERTEILRGCFRNLGRALGVFSQMSTKSAETLRKLLRPQGLEHIELAKSDGKGLILYTAYLGRALVVFSQMSTKSAETLRKLLRPQGLEHIELAKSDGKGLILYTAHLGAWELTSF